MNAEILGLLGRLRDERRPCAVATVVETLGSSSAKPGSKAVIAADGQRLAGWVGGGCAEASVCAAAREAIEQGAPRMLEVDMNDEILGVGMPCGGSMRVFVDPVLPAPTLWLLGHGRICEALARLAQVQGFEVVVNDPLLRPQDYPAEARLVVDDLDYAELKPAAGDPVVIATQHKGDHQSLVLALASPADYIGLIASRKRAGLIREFLREQGLAGSAAGRLSAPAGLDLGARTPEQIALALMAEIVMRRNRAGGRPLPEEVE